MKPDQSQDSREGDVSTAFDLVAYGFLMAGMSAATVRFAPQFKELCYLTGIGGFSIGIVFGGLCLFGFQFPKLITSSQALITLVALWLHIKAWQLVPSERTEDRLAVAITLLMTLVSAGQFIVTIIRKSRSSDLSHEVH